MKKRFIVCLTAAVCAVALAAAACAESITLGGTTIPAKTVTVYAPVSGTVDTVLPEAGQKIQAGDTLYTLKTNKVYADRDGTVTGIFAQPGDDADTVVNNYGGVMFIEGTSRFTVNASTENAYGSLETKYVHVGEPVGVICRSSASRKGTGFVTSVSGTSFTVEITEGTLFLNGDSVDVYRNAEYVYEKRIGRGSISRIAPEPIAAAGGIISIAVEDGAEVKRGDLLLETVDGTFDAYAAGGTDVAAEISGVVASVSVQAGGSVQKDAAAAEIYPLDTMRVEATIPEDYVNMVREGDTVVIEAEAGEKKTYEGTVVLVSAIAEAESEETGYRIVAEFVPDDTLRFGMNMLITAGQEEEPETAPAEETVQRAEETQETPEAENSETEKRGGRRERPGRNGDDGQQEMPGDGERPEMPENGEWPEMPGNGELPEAPDGGEPDGTPES